MNSASFEIAACLSGFLVYVFLYLVRQCLLFSQLLCYILSLLSELHWCMY